MNRLFLPFVALFLLPAAVVGLTDSLIHLPALEGIIRNLPFTLWIADLPFMFGAAPTSPLPIVAAGVGFITFLLSSSIYSQVTATGGDEMLQLRLYGRIAARLFSILLLAGAGTFAVCFYYMKLNRELSALLSFVAMMGAFRLVLSAHWPQGQGQGQTTAADAEAQRGNI